jgi:hypothetical protein
MHNESGIGGMIDDELKGGTPKADDQKPVEDLRTGAERAADMDKAQREKKAEAEIAELRAKWDAEEQKKAAPAETPDQEKAKKDIWEQEKRQLAGQVTELRIKMHEAGEEMGKEEKEAALKPMLAKIIEQAVRENANLGTDVIKTAFALPDVKGQAFDEGLRFITETISGQAMSQLETLLKGDQTEDKIVAALQKKLPEKIAQIRKSAEQKMRLHKGPLPTEANVAYLDAKRQGMKKVDKKKDVREAVKPFFEDVKKLGGGKKKPSAAKKKPSWVDRLFGRDKAA